MSKVYPLMLLVLVILTSCESTQGPKKSSQSNMRIQESTIRLWLGERQAENDPPKLYWSSSQIGALFNSDIPEKGYWSPNLILLELIKSDSGIDSKLFDNYRWSYQVEIAAYKKGTIITGVAFSNPGERATYNMENQYFHPVNPNVKMPVNAKLGIIPVVTQPPMILRKLKPGYYVARLSNPTIKSNWVVFQIK